MSRGKVPFSNGFGGNQGIYRNVVQHVIDLRDAGFRARVALPSVPLTKVLGNRFVRGDAAQGPVGGQKKVSMPAIGCKLRLGVLRGHC
jgi:hypothetical protein